MDFEGIEKPLYLPSEFTSLASAVVKTMAGKAVELQLRFDGI